MPFFQGEQEAGVQKEVLKEPTYVEELLTLFRSNLGKEELLEKISDYHESDIADAMEQMTPEERKKLYPLLGEEYIAEILSYTEDAAEYLQEINLENAARVISEMDSDDAVDVLENLDADTKTRIVDLLDDDAEKDVKLILSYEDDEIGSKMTTNFIVIGKNLNIRHVEYFERMVEIVLMGASIARLHALHKSKGFVIYPGKISKADTFRIGNIGDVHPEDFARLVEVVRETEY